MPVPKMGAEDSFSLPSTSGALPRPGHGGGRALATLTSRRAPAWPTRARALPLPRLDEVPLRGQVLARPRTLEGGVDDYLALGGLLPPRLLPRSLFVDLFA